MISPGYIGSQFRAVIAMAANNPAWRDRLDDDADGFYRSFFALVLTLPLAVAFETMAQRLFTYLPDSENVVFDLPFLYVAVLQVIVTTAIWAGSVTTLIMVARALTMERSISPLVVGYNWAEFLYQLLQALTLFVILISPDPTVFYGLLLGPFLFRLYLMWGVFRRTLDLNLVQTGGLIVMLYVVAILINLVLSAAGFGLFRLFGGTVGETV